ncbi:acyl-CoA hydrolase [Nitritalea halalkaliphila LW7]|uniref:Acyl-CoA hydrolase n=1 Tax=Nitritalea halalkaliphila LW7 TaxID=1189621 RepID=I5C9G0_9BACT|nr:acyl-CoA thioesterase [Nitritalea halalkaliphila]EIM78462.1 acyl-CoA hydrolase [Nitritalea halalkaliphila LW7]
MNTAPTLEERKTAARTSLFKAVFPNTTNHYDTLFGGNALQLMDEVAFIAATRFCRKKVVTVSTGKIDFNHAIPAGTIIELVGEVIRVGRTSLEIEVSIYVEEMYSEKRERAIRGNFTFVAVDEARRPISVL